MPNVGGLSYGLETSAYPFPCDVMNHNSIQPEPCASMPKASYRPPVNAVFQYAESTMTLSASPERCVITFEWTTGAGSPDTIGEPQFVPSAPSARLKLSMTALLVVTGAAMG